jgi:hypothetical protein
MQLQGLVHIASMTTLRSLRLAECNPVTNSGMSVFSSLTNLEKLSFLRCIRISEKGMHFLAALPKLDSLTVYDCSKVFPTSPPTSHARSTDVSMCACFVGGRGGVCLFGEGFKER